MSPYVSVHPGVVSGLSLLVSKPHTRVERSIHDVNEKKSARRAEIERRCADLAPPIKPSTLALMDSFAAALQIAMPLTDQAWELLKPRLLAQREAAEQQEREQLAQNQFLMQQTEERRQQEAQLREAKESLDREWEESQKSVREKLQVYADNFIRDQWQNGDAVNKNSSAQFAADMLLHVRHRFYTSLAQEDARMRAMGIPIPIDTPNAAPTRKLTLENMRWVYENKVKPLTEHFQKELFLCNACDNHGRYYSLDSVVQHFAAKHTDSLSMGTAVVYWKADWPELPPFDPNPTAAKASMYALANSSPALTPAQPMFNAPTFYPAHATAAHALPDQPIYGSSHNGQTTYSRLPQGYGSASPAYQQPPSPRNVFHRIDQTAAQGYNHPPTSTYPAAQGYGIPAGPQHHEWRRQPMPNNPGNLYQQHFPPLHQGQQLDFSARPGSALSYVSQNQQYQNVHPSYQFSRPQPPASVASVFKPLPPGQPMGIYQVQIQELANNAREIWNRTSDVSDMSDSVRVQVIIRHVVLRFKDKYTNEPNLALFTDGLNNSSQMSPMRALSGLSCKACASMSRMGGTYGNTYIGDQEHRMHTLPALLAHFQSAHVEHVQPVAISPGGIEIPRLDWKFDMVEMPDATVVRNLMYSHGITQAKLHLIATVLPSYFPSPLPQVEPEPAHDSNDANAVGSASKKTLQDHELLKRPTRASPEPFDHGRSALDHFRYSRATGEVGDPHGSGLRLGDGPEQNVLGAEAVAREDEYDPHRPAYVKASRAAKHMAAVPVAYGHRPHSEHEESSAHGVVRDPRDRHNVESMIGNRSTAAALEYAVPQTRQPPSERFNPSMQDFPVRIASQPHARWAAQESRTVEIEREPTPEREPLNAAEQFLRSFDLTTDTLKEPTHPNLEAGALEGEEYSHEVGAQSRFRPSAGERSRLSNHFDASVAEYSGKSSPSDSFPAQVRYALADDTTNEPHQTREYDRPYSGRRSDAQPRTQHPLAASPDNQALSRARSSHLPAHLKGVRDSPSRRPNSRFERYEAQRQGSQQAETRSPAIGADSVHTDDGFHRDHYSISRPAEHQIYAAEAEEQYRSQPRVEEIMYRRAPQASQQIRYVDKPDYLEPIQDRYVEYVRVPPQESQTSGSYYVRRPAAHDESSEYVGYEPTRPHEQVFEREGHLYTRAPPSSAGNRDPYGRPMSYQ
jgi:hypothetical protein